MSPEHGGGAFNRAAAAVLHSVWLCAILGGAALLLIAIPYSHVFPPAAATSTDPSGFVNVQTHDSWYHLRLIEYDVRHFPRTLHFDPYLQPAGDQVPTGPLYDWMTAAVARPICGGQPETACVDRIAAFASPVAALLTLIVVFQIGRRLFDPVAGLVAAALLATMPSPFLAVSVLGVVDHHAGEVLFSSLTMLGLAMAVQRARDVGVHRARVAAASAGLALGAYLLTWTSGALLVAILALWAGAGFLVDPDERADGRSGCVLAVAVAIAAACVLIFARAGTPKYGVQLMALGGTLLGLAFLEAFRRTRQSERLPSATLAAAAAAALVVAVIAERLPMAHAASETLTALHRMLPRQHAAASEAQSMFEMGGIGSSLWWMFRAGALAAVPGAIALVATLRRRPERLLLATWTACMLLAAIGQIRFGYYLAVCVALLGGWSVALATRWLRSAPLRGVAALVLAAALCYPSVASAESTARLDLGLPGPWRQALQWMRSHTPEPFGAADRFWSPGQSKAAYTVMDWWEHGYWIIHEAHRVPVANPMQTGAEDAAKFYTGTDPRAAVALLHRLRARYVVVGEEVPLHFDNVGGVWLDWFDPMLQWLQLPQATYAEQIDSITADGWTVPITVFYPAYYQAMADRLYFFGGRAVTPDNSTWVVTVERRENFAHRMVRIAVNLRRFATLADAQAEVARRGPGDHRIVGLDPRQSPVPLDAVPGLRDVYDSSEAATAFPGIPSVRIFEVPR